MNRHEQHKAATRQKLLGAAREVIVEKGYDDTDILDITERANVSKATFYKHFPNKEECACQLMLQGFEALVEQIFKEKQTAPSREEWALRGYRALFVWAEANREFLLIMVGGAASHRLNVFGRNYMAGIIERILNEPSYQYSSRYSSCVVAQIITGVLIQLLDWWLENDTGYSADGVARLVDDVLTHGLGPLS
jgi:AcrR family transcriptional regulator